MAVITRPDLYPNGTNVKVFRVPTPPVGEFLKNNSGDPATWKVGLTFLETVAASLGKLVLPSSGGPLLCWANVGGQDVYLTARGEAGTALTTAAATGTAKAANTSTVLLANQYRQGLEIRNIGPTNVMYIGLGKEAILKQGVGPIAAGAAWDGKVGGVLWKGSVDVIAETADVAISLNEV